MSGSKDPAAQTNKFHRILIVDDSPEDRALYRHMFAQAQDYYQIMEAGTVGEGILLQKEKAPDCVLLDFRLPDEEGIAFLRQDPNPHSAIIMVTGQGDERVAVEAMKLGAEDYIVKNTLSAAQLSKTINDAIEKHSLREQIHSYQKNLERSNRELSDFAFTVAHDLKSPLRKIISFAEMLAEEAKEQLDPACMNYVQRMQVNAVRMQRLIENLLTYAQAINSDEKKVKADIGTIVREIKDEIDPYLKEHEATVVAEPLPVITAYPVQMKQILSNLITNGVKYRSKDKPLIQIGAELRTGYHLFWVKDNGIGIPEKFLDKIFKPFNRLHAADAIEGSGLGLSICQKAVDKHGGKIWAESREGEGTTVYFSIPSG